MGVLDAPAASLTVRGEQALLTQRSLTLAPWFLALANRSTARANAVVLGTSITQGHGATAYGNQYVQKTTTILRQRLGIAAGGVGFVGQNKGVTSGVTTMTWPCVLAGGASSINQLGPTRAAIVLAGAGQTATFTVTGTSADIIHDYFVGGGSFSYSIDGGSATTVSTNHANQDGQVVTVSLGASGSHTITLAWVSGTAYIGGVNVYNGDETSGVCIHNLGYSGSRSDTPWTLTPNGTTSWPAAVAALKPSLICIELGVNDMNNGQSPTATQFQANLQTLVGYLRAVTAPPVAWSMANVPVVFIAYTECNGQTAVWPNYVAAIYAAAAALSNAVVFDLTKRMPGYDQGGSSISGLFYDTIHPGDKGHALMADSFAEFLLPR